MRISANTTLATGRWRLIDIYTNGGYNIDSIILSATQSNPNWEIYIDKDINSLAQPTQPSLAAATTGGTIPRSTPIYVIITTVDANGVEGPPSDAYKTVTTGANTDTNKVTVTISAVSGASSYNIYASTTSGSEGFVGNTATTSYVITSLPLPANMSDIVAARADSPAPVGYMCPTIADFFVYGHKDGSESLNIINGYPINYRLIVYVTFITTGQPSFSALLG